MSPLLQLNEELARAPHRFDLFDEREIERLLRAAYLVA
jgi:hypothetical protein